MRLLSSSLALLPLLPLAHSWGFVGHSIVATIAEIHLHPSVLSFLRSPSSALLPSYAHGHLAPVASWPDRIRMVPEYRGWSGELHYSSWLGDHPPEVCSWPKDDGTEEVEVGMGGRERVKKEGEEEGGGWKNERDVLHAIANYTMRLERNPQDWESLRFLIHFLGDVHQPMHLTNRERGGNQDPIRWEGRKGNLHGLWDNLLIARKLREQGNYTTELPSRQIESALTGAIYDPLIRLLLWEGVRSWWKDLLPSWLSCPIPPSSSSLPLSTQQTILSLETPTQEVRGTELSSIVCPVHWASGTHKVTCELAFPPEYDQHANPPVEVGGNTDYYRAIADSLTIERLLTQAGLRLAATLNTVFRDVAKQSLGPLADFAEEEVGPLNLKWMEELQ
ncbi:S1/P1 nuclease [Sporobolomyces salmoneus]|uniref:S1/P1 nuclease n=1 Tax=Sporobolomyces salmoneus TaxID=183962 RepID=UPI0031745670